MLRLLAFLALSVGTLSAAITKIYVVERSDVLEGKNTGPAGPYERILARAHFAVDPSNEANRAIRDLQLAPRNAQGLVEFSADLLVIKPREPKLGNGTVLLEVPNRGGRSLFGRFNYGRGAGAEELGDLFLMEQGFTLVWIGWQFDVPATNPNLLRLYAPVATDNGKPIRGIVRAEFIPDSAVTRMPLADRNHVPYLVANPADSGMTVTVRDEAAGERTIIPRNAWQVVDSRDHIEMSAGFQPGKIYELVYTSENPTVVGLGLAAVRDIVSFLKYVNDGTILLGDQRAYLKRAIGFGHSQNGRFLRTFLYYGFNQDEKGRKVFDGVWANAGGAGRGSFNHRFAQPSRDGYAHLNTLYQTDMFPFTDTLQTDPQTGRTDSVLGRTTAAAMPKVFYTTGSWEYWNRSNALTHTSLDGRIDVEIPSDVRIYAVAGAAHNPAQPGPKPKTAQYRGSANDFRPFQRAMLIALNNWIKDGKEPPPSTHPRVANGGLVPVAKLNTPRIPSVEWPTKPKQSWPMDFGPDFLEKGIVTIDPPRLGKPYAALVPQVDADGNEIAGVKLPWVAVPVGTFTGWNLRDPSVGSPNQLAPLLGAWFPFPRTRQEREAMRDPRLSLEERYGSKEGYLAKVEEEARRAVSAGFLLERDLPWTRDYAARLWDAAQQR